MVVWGGTPPAQADFLTTVDKGMNFVVPKTWPAVDALDKTAVKALINASRVHERCATAAEANWKLPTERLTDLERQVLRKVFDKAADKVGLVFGAALPDAVANQAKGLACGTLLYLSGTKEEKVSAGRLDRLAKLLYEGTNRGAKRTSATTFHSQKWAPWLKQVCGTTAGLCTWPASHLLPKNPPPKGKGPCQGSGKQIIAKSPGPTGHFRGGWECAGRNPRLAKAEEPIKGAIPHGFGTMKQSKGMWIGHWKWGRPHGEMLFVGAEGERQFGAVKGGTRFHGVVKLPSALGFTRFVTYAKGQDSDEGEDAWVTLGDVQFKGTWKAGMPHEGELKTKKGAVYAGRLCKGAPCSKARLTSAALTYEGRWRRGKPQGQGVAAWLDTGHKYLGAWKNGVPEGVGKLWVDDEDGKAVWTWNGTFKGGKRSGKGQLTFDTCSVKGTWIDGKMSGETTFSCTEFEYVGGMMGSTPHGRGALTYKADGSRYRGRFHLGTLIDGTARWRATSDHPLAKFLVAAGKAVFPGYTQKRLYYKGKFRGVKPHGAGALFLVAEKPGATTQRLVLEGEFDNRAAEGISSLKACKETQGADADEWTRGTCSKPWVEGGSKTTPKPVFP